MRAEIQSRLGNRKRSLPIRMKLSTVVHSMVAGGTNLTTAASWPKWRSGTINGL
jgi:hypothetical protein